MSLQPIVFAEPLDAMIERARNSPCPLYPQKRTLFSTDRRRGLGTSLD
jgi:hypothetical protein